MMDKMTGTSKQSGCNVKFLENLRKERMTAIDELSNNSSKSLRGGSGIKTNDDRNKDSTSVQQSVPLLLVNSEHAQDDALIDNTSQRKTDNTSERKTESTSQRKRYSLTDIVTAVLQQDNINCAGEDETRAALIHLTKWKMRAQVKANIRRSHSSENLQVNSGSAKGRRGSTQLLLDVPSPHLPRRQSLESLSLSESSKDTHVLVRSKSFDMGCLLPNDIDDSNMFGRNSGLPGHHNERHTSVNITEIKQCAVNTEHSSLTGLQSRSTSDTLNNSLTSQRNKLPALPRSISSRPDRHKQTSELKEASPPLLRSLAPGSFRAVSPGNSHVVSPGSSRAVYPGGSRIVTPGSSRAPSVSPCFTRRRLSVSLPVQTDGVPTNVEDRLLTRTAHYKLQKYLEETRSKFTTAQKLELEAKVEAAQLDD